MFKKALMLRAEVPPDKERITFSSLEECDDMWTHLFCKLCEEMNMDGEIWHYNGGPRKVRYTNKVIERWIPNLKAKIDSYSFDFVFARGGFSEYIPVIKVLDSQKCFKMYYGAGKRFFPIPRNSYNLVLVDSKEQKRLIKQHLPNQKVSLFIKPAAENIFNPVKVKKKYDVCVSFQLASYTKRFPLIIDSVKEGNLSTLIIGDVKEDLQKEVKKTYSNKITFAGRRKRKELPKLYSECKVGLATHSSLESCPRVIPEFLACDLPIVVTNDTLFWKEKYIDFKRTGFTVLPDPSYIAKAIQVIIKERESFDPRRFYMENLTLEKSSKHLVSIIEGSYK